MSKRACILGAVVFSGLGLAMPAGAITVNTSTDATAMADALINDPNIAIQSATYTGNAASAGFFSNGTDVVPFASGVALSSGALADIPGPNTGSQFGNADANSDFDGPGDTDLDTVAGFETADASVLTIDFIPTGNRVSFQFVFASEEYNEFVDTDFNDAFAFLLNGQNIALVPGTLTPITINTINEDENSQFFLDNTVDVGAPRNTTLDGLAGAEAGFALFAVGDVNPGVVNTIKLGIADASDGQLDSAVFLAGGSFVNQEPDVDPPTPGDGTIPEPVTASLSAMAALAIGLRLTQRRA